MNIEVKIKEIENKEKLERIKKEKVGMGNDYKIDNSLERPIKDNKNKSNNVRMERDIIHYKNI